jgi:hypothetical protein
VHENDRQRQMETRRASDVAQLPQNTGHFPEKHFGESEKMSGQIAAAGKDRM